MKKLFKYLYIAALILFVLSAPAFADAPARDAMIGLGLGVYSSLICIIGFFITLILVVVSWRPIVLILLSFCALVTIALGIFYLWLCVPQNDGIELTLLLPFFWFVINTMLAITKANFSPDLQANIKNGNRLFRFACLFILLAHARNVALQKGINIAGGFGSDVLDKGKQVELLRKYGINVNQEPVKTQQEPPKKEEEKDTPNNIHQDVASNDYEPAEEPASDDDYIKTLNMAILNKNSKKVAEFIAQGADVNQRYGGYTPLMMAVLYNDIESVKLLINANADVNASMPVPGQQDVKLTALMIARNNNFTEMEELLQAAGAKE